MAGNGLETFVEKVTSTLDDGTAVTFSLLSVDGVSVLRATVTEADGRVLISDNDLAFLARLGMPFAANEVLFNISLLRSAID